MSANKSTPSRERGGSNEMDGLSSYYRAEEDTIHCLTGCLNALKPVFSPSAFSPSACLSRHGLDGKRKKLNNTC